MDDDKDDFDKKNENSEIYSLILILLEQYLDHHY